MSKLEEAIDRIKRLECPTGEVENSLSIILEDYGVVADSSSLNIKRNTRLDADEAEAYSVKIPGEDQSIVVLAETGYDGYVAKVVDVYKL